MIRGVIFDLGNTLMYFDGDWDEVTAKGVTALKRSLVADGIRADGDFGADFVNARLIGRDLSARTDVEYTATRALRDTLTRHGYPGVPDQIVARALESFFEPEEMDWVSYPDARQTLEQLRARGLKVGLISNATDDGFIQRITRGSGLHEYMDPVISSAALPWRKPDPRIFRFVLDGWNLQPEEVIMVGDWPSADILGAHRAQMLAVLIEGRWPEPPRLENDIPDKHLLDADQVIRQLSELSMAMEQLDYTQKREANV